MLISTKLNIPLFPERAVSRPALLAVLDGILSHKLALISAPAGFGKTTLLSEWVSRSACPVCWLTLDQGDNDFFRFAQYIAGALQVVDPELCEVVPLLAASQPPPARETVLTALINDLALWSDPLVLVLDDYHHIQTNDVHEALGFLLEHQPQNLHVVILTRADPPLMLGRLRARREMLELRESDLQFAEGEARQLFRGSGGRNLTDEEVRALLERTEGWAAGLQLAALSMTNTENVAAFIRDFSGSHDYIVDYLTDEVLGYLPGQVTSFLLKTAILDQMNGPLCDALTGFDNGQETLEELRKSNLFIMPMDAERSWYRYHHLFLDLLRERQRVFTEHELQGLHMRAEEWYAQNEQMLGAVHHALAAKRMEQAADYLVRCITESADWASLNASVLEEWLSVLPEELVSSHPRLQQTRARVYTVRGNIHESNRILGVLEDMLRSADQPDAQQEVLLSSILADRISNAILQGRVRQAADLARKALSAAPAADLLGQMRLTAILAMTLFQMGNIPEALKFCQESLAAADQLGIPVASASLMCGFADVLAAAGQLRRAVGVCEHAQELASSDNLTSVVNGPILAVRGKLLFEQDSLPEAEQNLRNGMAFLRRNGPMHTLVTTHLSLTRVLQAARKAVEANDIMEQALALISGQSETPLASLAPAYKARLWLGRGLVDMASGWAEDYEASGEKEFHRTFENLTLARILLAQSRPGFAMDLLSRELAGARENGRGANIIEIHLLQALAFDQIGDLSEAQASMANALRLAEPEGFRRVFLGEGVPAANILKRMVSGAYTDFIQDLLSRFNEKMEAPPELAGPESITEREMEILYLLETEMTVPEIADTLFVAPSTVRSHIKSIYSKLAVHSRFEAVVRARDLSLLS